MKTVIKRARADTPPFFRKLRFYGLAVASIAASVLTAPIALPAVIITAASYLATAAAVAVAVSQLAVSESPAKDDDTQVN